MICPYCDEKAKWCENKEIYGRNYGKSYMCYYCKPCDAYVGCHKNTRRELGTMANSELREWRKRAHRVLDPLWLKKPDKKKARIKVYSKLSKYFGKDAHVGASNIEECKAIIYAIRNKLI